VKPAPFAYHDPTTVAEAADLLGRLDNARPLAGGQSLVPMMNFRFVTPDHLVDLNGVAELAHISAGDALSFGAMTRQRDVEFSADVARLCPVVREALLNVGHRQTRNRGTLGGSLCHLDPAAEMPALMMLHDATLSAAGPAGRSRTMPMSDFALGYMTSALAPDELLTRIDVPLWPAGHGYAWREFARRHGDFALASAGALLTLDDNGSIDRIAVVIAGLGPTPVRLGDFETGARGARLNDDLIAGAASAAKSIEAMDDIHGSAAYRQHLAGVLVARALRAAAERASERTAAHV
jgi:carbon-monoxide dehydrogenase medium subunit